MDLFIFISLQLLLEVKSQGLDVVSTLPPFTENDKTSPILYETTEGLDVMSIFPPLTENNITPLILNKTTEGLDVVSTLPPLTENNTTPLILNETTEAWPVTSSTEIMTDPITTDLEFNAITDSTEDAPDNPLLTEGLESERYSNTKMFFFIAVVATGVGIVLTGLMGICMYWRTRRPKAERIWIECRSKKHGFSLPAVSSDSSGDEDPVYSSVNLITYSSPTPENTGESKTQVELNPLYYTILTQPCVSSASGEVYSQLTVL